MSSSKYYKVAIIAGAVLLSLNAKSQKSTTDTVFKSQDTLIVYSSVNQVFDFLLWDSSNAMTSVFIKDKKTKSWRNLVDTVFYNNGDYFLTVNYYYHKNNVIRLGNSYQQLAFHKNKTRFAFFIVIDSIKIVNSFRIIDKKEVFGQYWLARIRTRPTDKEITYINTSYDQVRSDSFNEYTYGVKFFVDSTTKYIKKIEFSDVFFSKYAPNVKGRFKKIDILNDGRIIMIK